MTMSPILYYKDVNHYKQTIFQVEDYYKYHSRGIVCQLMSYRRVWVEKDIYDVIISIRLDLGADKQEVINAIDFLVSVETIDNIKRYFEFRDIL